MTKRRWTRNLSPIANIARQRDTPPMTATSGIKTPAFIVGDSIVNLITASIRTSLSRRRRIRESQTLISAPDQGD